MTAPFAPLCAALLIGFALPAAQAQSRPVYRCGNVYQHTPCPGGAVVASPTQTAAQRAEARRVAELERQLAARKKKEQAEAAAKPASAPAPKTP